MNARGIGSYASNHYGVKDALFRKQASPYLIMFIVEIIKQGDNKASQLASTLLDIGE